MSCRASSGDLSPLNPFKKTMRFFVFAAIFLLPFLALAELPPSAYESMQTKAPEYLKIQVMRVDIEPGQNPEEQKVVVMALVDAVDRTGSGIKVGDFITIGYTVMERPRGWTGPGEVPILAEDDKIVAYLEKNGDAGEYKPAAGRMSFSNF